MKKLSFFIFYTLICYNLIGQEAVGINNDNPDPSAVLDIVSTDKGVLIPRMSSAQRTAIATPATGLMVYDSTTNTFWFYNGTVWTEITSGASLDELSDADEDTKIQVEEAADEDIIRFDIGGKEYFRMNSGRFEVVNTGNSIFIGADAGTIDDLTDNNNVFIGESSGSSNVGGSSNIGLGYQTLLSNVNGLNNVAIGSTALQNNTSGSSNISIGSGALASNTTSDNNLAIGNDALSSMMSGSENLGLGTSSLFSMQSGSYNLGIGYESLRDNISGSSNTSIGHYAGSGNLGSGNVFIGFSAGTSETGSNKLYIESSSSSSPLIWGDFSTDSLVVNGNFHVTGNISYVGTITDVSDYRLKENFDTLTRVISLIEKLQAYSYNLKGSPESEREYGLIAQEVQKIFPEMVQVIDQEKGYLGVSYVQLVPILLQAIKEQQLVIEDQREKVSASLNLLERLKESLEHYKESNHEE